jgi:zinc transport system ATP-binding protein
MALIEISDLTFAYGAQPILKKMSVAINAGEYISVVGSNGSGKSTFVKLILGLLKPQGGAVKVAARRIGYISQRKDSSYESFPITVYELLNSYAKILRVKDARTRIAEWLDKMKLTEYQDKLVANLSGGQYQKLLIARSLLGNPELLILDEPSQGVDLRSQAEIYKLLRKLNVEKRITIISVEHNLRAAVKNSSAVFHIAEGHGHLCNPNSYLSEFEEANNVAV